MDIKQPQRHVKYNKQDPRHPELLQRTLKDAKQSQKCKNDQKEEQNDLMNLKGVRRSL